MEETIKVHYEANDKQNFLNWLERYIREVRAEEYAKGFEDAEKVFKR